MIVDCCVLVNTTIENKQHFLNIIHKLHSSLQNESTCAICSEFC